MLHCGVTVAAAAGKCGLHLWLDKSLVHVDVNALELEDAVQCIQLYKNLKSPAAELGEWDLHGQFCAGVHFSVMYRTHLWMPAGPHTSQALHHNTQDMECEALSLQF